MIPAIAAVIAAGTLLLILTERLNHTIAALAGGVVMLAAGKLLGFFDESQAIAAIEFDAIGLLLGMMILVSILEPTGAFQYLAVMAGRLSKGEPWRLILLLGGGTALVSLFLSNLMTVVLVGPITILITELLGVSPIPYLMAQALLSDTAGVGTSIGDPASILVASASGNSFTDFLTHALPVVGVAAVVTLVMFRYLFSKELSRRPADPEVVDSLDARQTLHDASSARKVAMVLGLTITMFIFQGALNLTAGFIALAAAALALLWIRPDVRAVLQRIDWPVLLFFVGLFIIVGGLESAGAFDQITKAMSRLGQQNPVALGVVIIWVVAALSALVDNIPVTITMISLLRGLAATGVNISPLWWAVVFGAGFGGNATSIGSSANIVIVGLSERTRTPITPKLWTRTGLPIAVATCVVGTVLFVLAFPLLGR